ncbi:YchJ family metal-binding protein [Kitasatospora sp. NPDC048540]|uniref:YchJ family protein n=1 Tax=unclassified Kitasatospora TaxID=2633591 RepID=UPI00053A6F32|nr:YchJ family metal-binding protein [Kitasatospora sp. MBT63]
MSRRPAKRPQSARPARGPVTDSSPCPCGLPAPYGECCGRLHAGRAEAVTAEQLMRSRFSAFAVRDEAYLLRSWDPLTRPPAVDFDPGMRWVRLEVLGSTDGGAFHGEGTVAFRAHFTDGGRAGAMEENSRFRRHEGRWVYLDALPED